IVDAQLQAIPFYSRLGFVAEGDEFLDGGIPHRRMRLRL
ncbi:MAG: GNAT family N-acetyltransferase, partial [Limnochordia bacterium]